MRKTNYLVLLLMLLMLTAGCSSTSGKSDLIGKVNGQGITRSDYDNMLKLQKVVYQEQNGVKLEESSDALKQVQNQVFNQLVDQQLLKAEAQKQGISVSDQDVSTALSQFKTDPGYEKVLKDAGLSEADLKSIIKDNLIAQKAYGEMEKKFSISDAEIKDYYQQHQADYKDEAGMQIYHILVKTETEARDIIARLKNGSDFAQLAKQYSQDPGSKDQGGYTGIGNADSSWVAPFKEAALKLKAGEFTEQPVKSEFGYHIIKAGKQVEAQQKSLDQVQNDIRSTLQNQKTYQALQALHQKADIEDLRSSQ